jgi:hypothetical protein
LAALHKWTHIDPVVPESLTLLRDDLLAQLIGRPKTKLATTNSAKVNQPLFAQEEESDEESDDGSNERLDSPERDLSALGRASKAKVKGSGSENEDDDVVPPPKSAAKKRSAARESPVWSMSVHSDDDQDSPKPVTKKRKTTKAEKGPGKERLDMPDQSNFELGIPSAKYDLTVTKPGQITFLFEKVSRSKL